MDEAGLLASGKHSTVPHRVGGGGLGRKDQPGDGRRGESASGGPRGANAAVTAEGAYRSTRPTLRRRASLGGNRAPTAGERDLSDQSLGESRALGDARDWTPLLIFPIYACASSGLAGCSCESSRGAGDGRGRGEARLEFPSAEVASTPFGLPRPARGEAPPITRRPTSTDVRPRGRGRSAHVDPAEDPTSGHEDGGPAPGEGPDDVRPSASAVGRRSGSRRRTSMRWRPTDDRRRAVGDRRAQRPFGRLGRPFDQRGRDRSGGRFLAEVVQVSGDGSSGVEGVRVDAEGCPRARAAARDGGDLRPPGGRWRKPVRWSAPVFFFRRGRRPVARFADGNGLASRPRTASALSARVERRAALTGTRMENPEAGRPGRPAAATSGRRSAVARVERHITRPQLRGRPRGRSPVSRPSGWRIRW